jgi:tetratricopeptide (TPR) repeat protein
VGIGFSTAKSLMSIEGEERTNYISKIIARCPTKGSGTDSFHSQFVLSIHEALRDPGYENRKVKRAIGAKLEDAAKIFFRNGSYEDGQRALELAATLHPEFAHRYFATLGNLFLEATNVEDAHESYLKSLARDNTNWMALLGESVICLDHGDIERAFELVETGIARYSTEKRLWNQKAVLLRRIGKLEEALAAINFTLHLDQRYLDALENKFILLRNLGRFSEADAVRSLVNEIERESLGAIDSKR